MVDTAKVSGRRELHFQTLGEMLADADTLAMAERVGKLRQLGNWSLGQAFGHLAAFADYAFDGYPMKIPFFVKLIVRPMKNRMLKGPMPSGRRIPNAPGGTYGIEPLSLDEGLARMKAAMTRMQSQSPKDPNPIFGPLTHEQWIALNFRHAELHLSFFRAE